MHILVDTSPITLALKQLALSDGPNVDTDTLMEYLFDVLIESPHLHEDSTAICAFEAGFGSHAVGDSTDAFQLAYPHLLHVVRWLKPHVHEILMRLPNATITRGGRNGWSGTCYVIELHTP